LTGTAEATGLAKSPGSEKQPDKIISKQTSIYKTNSLQGRYSTESLICMVYTLATEYPHPCNY
jgi:hypothetical protein